MRVDHSLVSRCAPLVQNHVEKKKRKKRKKSNNTTQSAVTYNGKILSKSNTHLHLPLVRFTEKLEYTN